MGSKNRPVTFSGLVKAGRLESPPALPSGLPVDRQMYYDVEPDPAPPIEPAGDSAPAAPSAPANDPSQPSETADQPDPAEPALADGVVHELDTSLIDDSPYQPESEEGDRYDPVGIAELAQAFATAGQSSPIKVRRKPGGRYEVIAGHRRLRAARLIRARIKAFIVTSSDREARLAVMIDNEGVKAKCDYQKAKLYQCALDEGYATTLAEIAAIFATSKAAVSKRLSMMSLPAPILALLNETPNLFGATTAGVLHELVERYPAHTDIITQAVARLKEPDVKENSIKPWVAQMVAATQTAPQPKNDERENIRVITDKKKRSLYTARLRGRVVTIRLNGTTIDPNLVLDRLADVLASDSKLVSTDEE